MRILMVTSFPIPGEYDGTAMLPIKILRALKARGSRWSSPTCGRGPPGVGRSGATSRGRRRSRFPPAAWVGGLRRIRREFPFDLVHAQHYGGATRAHPACRLSGWPMVYEIHSLLGDEVERDRLGRGPGVPAPGGRRARRLPARRGRDRAGRAGQGGRRPREGGARRPGLGDLPGDRPGRVRPAAGDAGRDPGRRARATRSSCTSAASSTRTRGCRS